MSNSRYRVIPDNYGSVEEVQRALVNARLESSNLIVGIDFTKSNQWTGQRSFAGRSLHAISPHEPNPYEQALSIIGRTLSPFDEDNEIPCFGFGDSTTHDSRVFSFYPDHRACHGFKEALARYREIVPYVRLSGPTSFAPIINAAVDIVEKSGGQYHVLVIIADGQIDGPQEVATVHALVNASNYPLSIVLVGVGDGPWDKMQAFDDNLPSRTFDNFQFINFTQIMASNLPPQRKEAQFALAALMEIPVQYQATAELHLLSRHRGISPNQELLPPPPMALQAPLYMPSATAPPTTAFSYIPDYYPPAAPPPAPVPDMAVLECPVCMTDRKDMAFNCGHQTCRSCADSLTHCPICRAVITSRIRLY
jgi:E3 ubiquitin-protein ligase RGLG